MVMWRCDVYYSFWCRCMHVYDVPTTKPSTALTYLRGHREVQDHEDGEDDAGEEEGRDEGVLLEVGPAEHLVEAGGVVA